MSTTTAHTTAERAAHRFLDVLRRENACLAAGDLPGAVALGAEKHETAALLHGAVRNGVLPRALADAVLEASAENVTRLQAAMTVQARILEIVAQAAAKAQPAPVRYGARGSARAAAGPMALVLKA